MAFSLINFVLVILHVDSQLYLSANRLADTCIPDLEVVVTDSYTCTYLHLQASMVSPREWYSHFQSLSVHVETGG